MSGVYPKTRETLYEAYPFAQTEGDAASALARSEGSRDRVMVTLLALNFLLMAFFVVMTSMAETTRATVVAPPELAVPEVTRTDTSAPVTAFNEEERRRAVDVLRAFVAQVFAPVIAPDEAWRMRAVERIGNDRVDIEVPYALFSDPAYAAEGDAILAGIVGVVDRGVRGYRAELALRASDATMDVGILAERLVGFGLAPSALSVGVLRPLEAVSTEPLLRFTFLLLDDRDDPIVRLSNRTGGLS